jgi:hypothetical protein
MKKIFVIAGNYNQFVDWCRDIAVSPHSPLVKYIAEGEGQIALSGTRNPEVISIGTYRQRKDFQELEILVRSRTYPEIKIVYVDKPVESKPVKPMEFLGELTRKIAWRTAPV